MVKRTAYSPTQAAIAAANPGIAAGVQFVDPPRACSFLAPASLSWPAATIRLHRNGFPEWVEIAAAPERGRSSKLPGRALCGLKAHPLGRLEVNSDICSTQEYTCPYLPALTGSRDTVNGFDGRKSPGFWVDKYGFPVRLLKATDVPRKASK
jgi:hypothetical protein